MMISTARCSCSFACSEARDAGRTTTCTCGCPKCHVPVPREVPALSSTLPSPAPWYAEGSTADFSMSDLFTFGLVLDELGAFEETSDVLYYFEKPWKWTGERERWAGLGEAWDRDDPDQTEYILDNGTRAACYGDWLCARDEQEGA